MPYIDRTVFTSNDQSSGEVADPNLLESNDKHIADVVDANFTELNDFMNGENISRLGIVNVKDYGAKGDGSTDDTSAIQKAVDSVSFVSNTIDNNVSTAYPIIMFPKGKYKISSKINLTKHRVIGKEALIVGDGTHDCFYFDSAQRSSVEGVAYQNFNRCISFDTNNVAGAVFNVSRCNAWDSEVFVDSRSYDESRSTVLNIKDCFIHHSCKKAVIAYCDLVNIVGGNIQHKTAGENKMEFDANVILRDVLLVPFIAESEMRWVDMLDSTDPTRRITFSHARVSGENSGITAVYCRQGGNSTSENQIGIVFDNSQLSCGGGGPLNEGGVVVLADSADGSTSVTPNVISFKDSYKSGSAYPFIKTESGLPVDPQGSIGFSISIDNTTRGAGLGVGSIESNLEKYLTPESRIGEQKVDMDGGSFDINSAHGNIVFTNATAASDVSNILNGSKGSIVYLTNANNNSYVTVKHRADGTGNIWINGAVDRVIQPFETITLIYVSANQRWVLGESN